MSTKAEKKEVARNFRRHERWEELIQASQKDPKATQELKGAEKIAFGLYIQQRSAFLEFNSKIPPPENKS